MRRPSPSTPYYIIDKARLVDNLKIIDTVRQKANVKILLALKCFATWSVFDLMRPYLDGTTSSSPYEARLGYETFGKEVHAYSVGFSAQDIRRIKPIASKVIFNSISQLKQHYPAVSGLPLGLRINPGVSYSHYDLADPARRYSRLGVIATDQIWQIIPILNGFMLHFNCENPDFANFTTALNTISQQYENILRQPQIQWVSLGGGIHFTHNGYPISEFCQCLQEFATKFAVQVYLEPGEAVISNSAELVTTVVDVIHNEIDVAIVDVSVEAHMLDHLIYSTQPKLTAPKAGTHRMMIAGRSCLAGDIFGEYGFAERLFIGAKIHFADAAGYTMVKKNWFNGLQMPAIMIKELDGMIRLVRTFHYRDFKRNLS
ncbi:carboxynorspermidine decarboxylase [Achromatium sp. WMS1]|nr:carboxynorspermidine decarboxylase [Achromatium sp. WMS1]